MLKISQINLVVFDNNQYLVWYIRTSFFLCEWRQKVDEKTSAHKGCDQKQGEASLNDYIRQTDGEKLNIDMADAKNPKDNAQGFLLDLLFIH